jgi:tetratricopeptide (TPR) repeat protein
VPAIKREPTPPGPITDLFNRLDDLHSKAGRPSMREIARVIATQAGRGHISPSTVHNIFCKPQVPRWSFLELVVQALGGAQQGDAFKVLWEAAWRAENHVAAAQDVTDLPPPHAGDHHPEPLRWPLAGAPQAMGMGWVEDMPRPLRRYWSTELPSRNPNFTGRAAELQRLSGNLSRSHRPRVQVISGTGGIGKTELATEYIHRNIAIYQIIWWIRAEHPDRVREAFVKLGQRLAPLQATADSAHDRTVAAVREELQSGRWSSWLLVFDNVADPLDLQKYIPASRPGGHVIITAREPNWPSYIESDNIEVAPFTDAESVGFLRGRVRSLAQGTGIAPAEDERRTTEARRLATTLGHLPIAVGHAAAYLVETGQSVGEYLTRFTENARQMLSERRPADPGPSDLSVPVSGTLAMSIQLLTPDAEHLFNLCSFFSPEPIAAELFQQPTEGIDEPPGLAEFLSSPQRFRAARTQMDRLSLARVDGARNLTQVHRVVQAVTQGRLQLERIEAFRAYRAAADTLLARSNPGNPDHASSDQVYDLSLQHLESDYRFLRTKNPALRTLIIDQVRRLHLRGGHVEAVKFGQDALQVWRRSLGQDDLQVLGMSVEVAIAMIIGGRAADAHELILQIRPLLRRYTDGDGFKARLLCENIYGADRRARNQFREALDLDRAILSDFETVFGVDHERTLNVRANIAIDYRQLGQFGDALEADERTLEDRRRMMGDDDLNTLTSSNAVAHDMRGLGLYQESLDMVRRVVGAFEAVGGRENIRWLQACEGFATALRKAGHHWNALQESEQVHQRCRDYLGVDHMYTLRAAANLINDRRAVGNIDISYIESAEELAIETRDLCRGSGAPDVLLNTIMVNLASVQRVAGRPGEALTNDDPAMKGFIKTHGEKHPFTLSAKINYASDLAACGQLGEAIRIGQETLEKCRDQLGDDHPDTLIAASNLSADERAAGDHATAERRLSDVLSRYERTLTLEHPEARAAAQGIRLTAEIEPYDLF